MSAKRSILIVDNDAIVRDTLAEQLAGEHGFAVFTAETLDEATTIIVAEGRPTDAVILDIGMPDGDGRDFCATLRARGYHMPIIMLTGSDGEGDIVRGLNSGANDYITKPFRLNELLARLRAQFRISDSKDDAVFSVGRYTFYPGKKLLHDHSNNRRVWLTTTEVAVLKLLYRSDGCPLDRRVVLLALWGNKAGESPHMLETHIYRLRKKIELDPKEPALLLTVGQAYLLKRM
jgi:DNA-binding response OmpR family regulator